ncbi:MAG: GNAT family N-acetyltransferase [Streptosporangiaceae bacterium]
MTIGARIEQDPAPRIEVRRAGPDDVPAIRRLFTGLSADSARRRFQSGQPSPGLLAAAADLGPGTRCLVAVDTGAPGRVVGEARYVLLGPELAELAITVADRYQGRGLGRVLLAGLVDQARTAGIGYLRSVVLMSNTAMLSLLAHYGCAQVTTADEISVVTVDIATQGGMPGWPVAARGRRVLVEQRGWFADEQTIRLAAGGADVRRCQGPSQRAGRSCPLVTTGRCALAEQAQEIRCLLPEGDADAAAVASAHRRLWPERLVR